MTHLLSVVNIFLAGLLAFDGFMPQAITILLVTAVANIGVIRYWQLRDKP